MKLGVVFLIPFIVLLISGCSSFGNDSIVDIQNNPLSYEGKDVSLNGYRGLKSLKWVVIDDEGYFINLDSNCYENRVFSPGDKYTFTGQIRISEDKPFLNCNPA